MNNGFAYNKKRAKRPGYVVSVFSDTSSVRVGSIFATCGQFLTGHTFVDHHMSTYRIDSYASRDNSFEHFSARRLILFKKFTNSSTKMHINSIPSWCRFPREL